MYPELVKPTVTETLLHKVSLTCVGIQMYPGPSPNEPSATETYYTRSSLTCVGMQMYPGQMYPPPQSLNLVLQSPTTPESV